MSVNKAILIGRLGKDPESRYTDAGKCRCNFSIATEESYKGNDGQKHKSTTHIKRDLHGMPGHF